MRILFSRNTIELDLKCLPSSKYKLYTIDLIKVYITHNIMLKVANCIMKDFVLEKESIIRKFGEWTAYDIKLTDTLYTRDI